MIPVLGIYLLGVVIGSLGADGRPSQRIGLAIAWPIGPMAFVLTIALLFFAALIAFPLFGAAVVAIAVVGWRLLW